ncbi:uncharacterized protein EV422DRAFT_507653 [Fimicolochytrium jonesii]|uniref:uncharacterized protein n=1 Tax=Fimicolochytrium jonesii TaxID=1396493 RepID=UPI0022FEEB93|nr:uncharacterized protein EV422DRAFT_507653 [Fimicolochytrium jonesii]KAI8819203.1 hypothetical protein EV422DRAFT_507653 [Fimicolochytrium jonesii]
MQFRNLISVIAVAASAVASVSAANNIDAAWKDYPFDSSIPLPDLAIKVAGEARSLWHAHVTTVGDYAAAVASNNKDLAKAIQPHALESAPNMTNWLSNWYTDKDALAKFQTLFADHVATLAAIVDATKAGDDQKIADLKVKLADGGKKLSVVIESLNPEAYPKDVVFALLSEHENLAVAAGAQLIAQKWDEGYNTQITGFEQSKQVADALAKGVFLKLANNTVAQPDTSAPVSAAVPSAYARWFIAPALAAAVALAL